jgi:hypothetical protein
MPKLRTKQYVIAVNLVAELNVMLFVCHLCSVLELLGFESPSRGQCTRPMRFLIYKYFFPMARQSPVGQGPLSIEASRSHSGTPHSVGLLWTSDKPVAETST